MPTSFSHRPARNWLQIDLSVPEELSEYVSHQLTEITGNGVQFLASGDKEIIIGYLEKDDDYLTTRKELDTFLTELEEKTSSSLELSLKTIVEENWAENWKENYKPSKITDTITVKPTWETYTPAENEVVIVDEFTGRMMSGRRYGDGLHQALEAKEGVNVENENQTLASITFQNYFRLYTKLSGMTGTADTEASELMQIYNLER